MRTYTNWEAFFSQNSDSNWILVPLSLWTAAEIACGLFLSCVPTMPKFYQHFRSKVGNLSRSFQSLGESGHEFNSDILDTEPRRSTHHSHRPYERYGVSSHISKNSDGSIDAQAGEISKPISLEDLESMQSRSESAVNPRQALPRGYMSGHNSKTKATVVSEDKAIPAGW